MLGNPYIIVKIILVLAATAFIIYRLQVFAAISSFFMHTDKNDMGLKMRVNSYIAQHETNKVEAEISGIKDNIDEQFSIHLLRMIERESEFVLYFFNSGGNATNLKICSADGMMIQIKPEEKISANTSGCIRVEKLGLQKKKIEIRNIIF